MRKDQATIIENQLCFIMDDKIDKIQNHKQLSDICNKKNQKFVKKMIFIKEDSSYPDCVKRCPRLRKSFSVIPKDGRDLKLNFIPGLLQKSDNFNRLTEAIKNVKNMISHRTRNFNYKCDSLIKKEFPKIIEIDNKIQVQGQFNRIFLNEEDYYAKRNYRFRRKILCNYSYKQLITKKRNKKFLPDVKQQGINKYNNSDFSNILLGNNYAEICRQKVERLLRDRNFILSKEYLNDHVLSKKNSFDHTGKIEFTYNKYLNKN